MFPCFSLVPPEAAWPCGRGVCCGAEVCSFVSLTPECGPPCWRRKQARADIGGGLMNFLFDGAFFLGCCRALLRTGGGGALTYWAQACARSVHAHAPVGLPEDCTKACNERGIVTCHGELCPASSCMPMPTRKAHACMHAHGHAQNDTVFYNYVTVLPWPGSPPCPDHHPKGDAAAACRIG